MSVAVEPGTTWSAGRPSKVLDGKYYLGAGPGGGTGRMYDVSLDGRRFLLIKQGGGTEQGSAASSLAVVFNWFEELKRLAPR